MPKMNLIQEQIETLQKIEGRGFEINQQGLVNDLEKYASENTSIIIKVITVLGAFIGTSFLLTFFFTFKLFHEPLTMIIWGLGLIITSITLSNTSKMLLFETSFIAFLIYGGIILGLGLNGYKLNNSLICLCFFSVGLFIFLFTKNEIQYFLGVFVSFLSLFWVIILEKLFWMYHPFNLVLNFGLLYVFFREAKLISSTFFARRYNALKNAMIIIFLLCMSRVSVKALNLDTVPFNWISAIAPILSIVYILGRVLNKIGITKKSIIIGIQIVVLLLLLLTIIFPAISASIIIILICFWVNYKTGYIIGIISLCYFISQFYYDLSLTLLVKSELLLANGVLFGLLYFFSSNKLMEYEKV
jgi:Domain of unknown function (DUF4401)